MTDPSVHVELVHACAICGKPAALPDDGGMQLSVIDAKRHVVWWAVHPACLEAVLAPTARGALGRTFVD